jgi:hypothetical protein
MKNSVTKRSLFRLALLSLSLFALAALSSASTTRTFTTSVNIVNNSSREIRNIYFSHVDVDDWGDNQLTSAITPGQSYNLSNVACDQQQVKVVGEDQDGCFLSVVVNCGGSSTWTITNDTSRDCGY